MRFHLKNLPTIGLAVMALTSMLFLTRCGGSGGGSGNNITTEDENIAANAMADSTQAALAGAMDAYASANNLIVFSKNVGSNPGSSSFPCTVGASAGGSTLVTCQCDNFDANNPRTGIATIELTTTANTTTPCNGGPLIQSHTEQDFTLTFNNCSLATCNSGAAVTSQAGSDITGHITYDTNQCQPPSGINPRRIATVASGICTSAAVTLSGNPIAVSAAPTNVTVNAYGGVVNLPASSSGQVCANERAFAFNSLDDLATKTSCGPGGNCLDISGNWTQSFVCYDPAAQFCERNDNGEFTISQSSCTQVASDVLDVWTATEVHLTAAPFTVKWDATEDVNPEGSDSGEDYNENGTWTFSDADNFTSDSVFTFIQPPQNHGVCIANVKKGGVPARVTEKDCFDLCTQASNKDQVCP